jgi:hypothetical protein
MILPGVLAVAVVVLAWDLVDAKRETASRLAQAMEL